MIAWLKRFVRRLRRRNRGMKFEGPAGIGKTMTASALGRVPGELGASPFTLIEGGEREILQARFFSHILEAAETLPDYKPVFFTDEAEGGAPPVAGSEDTP